MGEYCGYVCEVKELRKHPQADRLQIATFFGNDTCVGLDIVQGEIGIYFPSDLQLSVEFCDENHMCRKCADGTDDTGYLDRDKRNIRPIKLRGEKSDGIFVPLSAVAYTGINLDVLDIGDKIDILNGHEICCKYIPKGKAVSTNRIGNKAQKKKKKKKEPVAPLFTEHCDTEQLSYNLNAFKPGDQIEITLKMHGCFISGTPVRMGNGKLEQIQRLKVGDEVLGYNFNTGKFEKTKIINVFHNAPSSKWNKIKISRNHLKGDKRGYITATPNHPFWSKELGCWIEAKDLLPGMKISTAFPSYILTKQQKEILIGSFLGDGCLLQFGNRTAELQNGCVKEKEEYLDWFVSIMNGLHYKEAKEYISGYGSKIVRAKTYRSADMYNYFKNLATFNNGKGRKLLPQLIQEITPLSLAIFYMEDGSLGHTDFQKDRAAFAICDYTEKQDCEIICDCFRKFNIEPKLYTDRNGYNRIRLNTKEAYKFFDLIERYIPPIMRYKLPKEYRSRQYLVLKDTEKFEQGFVFSEQEVLENIPVNETHKEYDLETELHNYIVGLSIVHNTSMRTGYLPVLKGYKRTFLDKIFHREGKPIYKYDYISGTRRTVLEDFEGGFYGSNAFRKQHHDKFIGKLHKGEEIYYECIGYVDETTPIMAKGKNEKVGKDFVKQYGKETVFSYGCELGTSDIYVYRMTMTNEDGDVVEYSPDFMRYRCEQMGVKCVPVFAKATIDGEGVHIYAPDNELYGFVHETNNAGDTVKLVAEKYYDGPDPIGKTHIREGVVVRIVNRPKFTAFKHKNFDFKVLSSIAIEQAIETGAIEKMSDDEISEL